MASLPETKRASLRDANAAGCRAVILVRLPRLPRFEIIKRKRPGRNLPTDQ
jgi:hypothetical protein